ncbi:hypothetical protein QUF83_15150 [Bacillus cereus]|uniref:hypothetical protein n=1 Tax=Bacillus cereus TaxID=1396 RepID=UPI0025A16043|nr:hypothetical protein [Bacillus cereus]MDM5237461.1 hypothetical protein [Bacillus cereus]
MDLIEYQVLLPRKFWEQVNNEEELNQMIEKYFSAGYPNYKILKIIQDGESHIAICERE